MITREMWEGELLDIDQTKEYFRLCSVRTEGFGEKHHILPKSVWPEYEHHKWNIIKLSYEDHYKAHEMLVSISKTENCRRKMLYAWNRVRNTREGLATTSEQYAALRLAHREMLSAKMSGENNPMFGKTGSDCPFFGKSHTTESRNKQSLAHTGTKASQETKDKQSKAHSGELNAMHGRKHSEGTKEVLAAHKTKYSYEQYTKSGDFVRSWSREDLDLSDNFCAQNVHLVCQGKVKTHKGFVWKKVAKELKQNH